MDRLRLDPSLLPEGAVSSFTGATWIGSERFRLLTLGNSAVLLGLGHDNSHCRTALVRNEPIAATEASMPPISSRVRLRRPASFRSMSSCACAARSRAMESASICWLSTNSETSSYESKVTHSEAGQ